MSDELKPCPFCGEPAALKTGMGEFWVECERVCQRMTNRKSEAVEHWNTRVGSEKCTSRELDKE